LSRALLHGYDVAADGTARRLDVVKAQGEPPAGSYRWLHLDLDDEGAISWLAQLAELPGEVVAALACPHPRPHTETVGGGAVLVLRAINTTPGEDPEDMVALLCWVEANRVLTMRRHPLDALREVESTVEAGRGPRTTAAFVAMLAGKLQPQIDTTVSELEEELDLLEEEAVLGELPGDAIRRLAELRRNAISIRRHLAPQWAALEDLLSTAPALGLQHEHGLRELAARTRRHVDVLDSIRERASVTQEEQSHHLAERLNGRMYALTVVAGIFLPLSFLTGLLGINVAGIPSADHPWAFLVVTGAMVAVVGLEVWLFRKMGWL